MGNAYLTQQLPQNHEEGHKVPRIARIKPLRVGSTHVFCGGTHRWRNDFARCVHQQLGQPFEHLLDDLWVGFLEVCNAEVDTNIRDATGNLSIGLFLLAGSAMKAGEAHTRFMNVSCSVAAGGRWLWDVLRIVLMRGL